MSLQTIINISNSIKVDRRKVIGIQTTRSQLMRIGETPTYNPWRFTVTVPDGVYADSRALVETLDNMDRAISEVISFGAIATMSWLYKYQGAYALAELTNIKVSTFVGNQLVLNITTLASRVAGKAIFMKGDIISIAGYPYPFTFTSDIITPATGVNTVTCVMHRPRVIDPTVNLAGIGLEVGASAKFRLLCTNMPVYILTPGAQRMLGSTMTNNAILSFDGEFELVEHFL